MKKIRGILSIVIIATMIFTSSVVMTFAEEKNSTKAEEQVTENINVNNVDDISLDYTDITKDEKAEVKEEVKEEANEEKVEETAKEETKKEVDEEAKDGTGDQKDTEDKETKEKSNANVAETELFGTSAPQITFTTADDKGFFNNDNTIHEISFLATDTINIPTVYSVFCVGFIDIGWHDDTHNADINDISTFVNDWKNNSTEDVTVSVVFAEIDSTTTSEYEVVASPSVLRYHAGDEADLSGLVIRFNATTPGGDVIAVTIDYDAEERYHELFTTSTIEEDSTILYIGFDDILDKAFPIKVVKEVSSIEVLTKPTKLEYNVGDKFDPTGLVIKVIYVDNSEEEVPYAGNEALFTFNPNLTTSLDESNDKVQVTFDNQSADIPITVKDEPDVAVKSISIAKNPNKTSYAVGDKLNPEGLVIRVTYSDDTTNNVIYNDVTKGGFTFNPTLTTSLTTSHTRVNVIYEEKSASFNIRVGSGGNPNPPSGGSGNSSSSSSASVGPMGDLTRSNVLQQSSMNLNTVNNIPQTELNTNVALMMTLSSMPENQSMPKANARDVNGNSGFGQWQRVPGTTTWYFLSGDLNANGTAGTVGYLTNGWYNLGWDGIDRWYHFDANGVMGLGWYEENGKTYYLQQDFSDNWYGKAVVGTHTINGVTYNFDESGALIQ